MDINVILQAITIIVMLIGVTIAVRQLSLLTKQIRNQYEWSTRQFALNYSITHNSRLREARIKLDEAFGVFTFGKCEALTIKQIDEAIEKEPSIYTDISYILAHWENMALAIDAHIANEKVAFEMVAGMVISYVCMFRNFIEKRKELNPRAYEYLLRRAKIWEDRLQNLDRPQFTPFYDVEQ